MYEPDNGYYWELLGKYLNHEITEKETAELFRWVNESPANRETFHRTTHLWHVTGTVKQEFEPDVTQAWQRFRAQMEVSAPQPETVAKPAAPSEGRVIPMYVWRVAAAVLIMLGVAWIATLYVSKDTSTVVLRAQATKQVFYLPDSSRVYLNRNSSVTYEDNLEGSRRVVNLKGEAFFQVRRNAQKPFVVLTGNAQTEVLGTSFTVKSDEKAGTTEVQVVTGKVALSPRKKVSKPGDTTRIILTPGFKGLLAQQKRVTKSVISDPNFRSWQTGRLEFNDMRLEQVIASLEHYFGTPINVQNEAILDCRFTGAFDQPALNNVVEVLSVSMNLRYEYRNGHYLLSGSGCQ